MMNIDNLDAMNYDELKEATGAFFKLYTYCQCLQFAREKRLSGEIQAAISWEERADGYYSLLPEGYRW